MEQELVKPSAGTGDITFGEWFLTLFLMAIPLVGIVLLFVWAFGSSTKPTKANWAKASLVWTAIGIVISFIITIIAVGISSGY